jgi:23S rRNA (cytidine1920-2'-O)/16S rRNA (cytidine1409-2'-O)-methyltransferase
MRRRLDAELVRRGLVRSREQAVEAIAAGRVRVGGLIAAKSATLVEESAPLALAPFVPAAVRRPTAAGEHTAGAPTAAGAHTTAGAATAGAATAAGAPGEPPYASRGAHKLAPALAAWARADPPLEVAGRRCLDAGASTGGFTDVLLRAGAAQVVAVDVGYGQLAWRLRTDPRVRVLDRCNARNLTAEAIGGTVDLAVADLSFISLRLVLPALAACTREAGDLVLLVKPQFEVGRGMVGRGGVVRAPGLRAEAVVGVAATAAELGLGVRDLRASPLPGPAGNVEYLLWLNRDAPALRADAVRAAVAGTPGPGDGKAAGAQGSKPDAPAGPSGEEA